MLFQKRVIHTKFDIYVFISLKINQKLFDFSFRIIEMITFVGYVTKME
jgi:hypothetical protein